MKALVPERYFGRDLSVAEKQELDIIAGGWNQAYLLGKFFKYGSGIIGNAAAMKKIAEDLTLSPELRKDLTLRNYYDWIGNVAFLVEKFCYSAALPAVGMAHYFGKESPMWDVGYLGGALLYNAALFLATIAWYGKVRCSVSMVNAEKAKFLEAQEHGQKYDIDTGCVNIALFNFANTLGRVPKHFVAHASTLALGLTLYNPELFSFLRNDFIDRGIKKLGEGTPAELVYSWSSFGFMVPKAIVYASIAFCVVAPLMGLGVSVSKTIKDIKEHGKLKGELRAGGVEDGRMEFLTGRMARLRREHAINTLGISAAVCVLGSGIATAYPATEPHSLFLTALYGLAVFGQFGISQSDVLKALPGYIADRIRSGRNAAATGAATDKGTTEDQKATSKKKGFFRKMLESVRAAKHIIDEANAEKKAAVKGLSFTRRVARRIDLIISGVAEWKFFFRAYMTQKKKKQLKPAK
jgi:hypothetical protein